MSNFNALSLDKKKTILNWMSKAAKDPVVFADKFLWTFNPKKKPYHFPFALYPFQRKKLPQIVEAITKGNDLFLEKCRDMGMTYLVLAAFLWFWKFVEGSNFLLGSRKEALVDNRGQLKEGEVSNKEESLFGKLDYMIGRLIPLMLPTGFNYERHFTFMSLRNVDNGNVISGETANVNFSRGGRHKAVLLDEFAFWEYSSQAWGATADTTACRLVLTTPGIKLGKAYRLRFGKDGEVIKVISIPYHLHPEKDAKWLAKERERRSKEDFAREIMMNWEVAVKGRVYDEIRNANLGDFPYNAMWPMFTTWDFGIDGVAIQWWQQNMDNGKPRLIESYFNSDVPIQYYYPLFGEPIDSKFQYEDKDLDLIEKVVKFKKPIHFGDPDVKKRTVTSPELTSTDKELRKVGIYVNTKPEANDFFTRREKTKVMLQRGIEVNETPNNDFWLECMQMARYPERSDNSQATTAVTLPIHDWTSHHRTATEFLAVNHEFEQRIRTKTAEPQDAYASSFGRRYRK